MRLTLAILAIFVTGPVCAQTRPSTQSMTCSAVRALVQARQAIVLSTGRDLYDRYVANDARCEVGQYAAPAFAPTADNPQCQLGLRCLPLSLNEK